MLISNRLRLIPLSLNDAPHIFQHFTTEINQYMYPSPSENLEGVHQFIRDSLEKMQGGYEAVYAITLKECQSFIGLVGLHNLKSKRPELGIWIKKTAHGHHYGFEAIRCLVDYAKNLGFKQLVYPVDTRNIPSKKIPLALKGEMVSREEVQTQDGRRLRMETYVITL